MSDTPTTVQELAAAIVASLNPDSELDRMMTPWEFAEWLGVSVEWLREKGSSIPGRIVETREVIRYHPRTYLAKRLRQ